MHAKSKLYQVPADAKFKMMSSATLVIFIVNYYHVGFQGDVGQEDDEEDQEG